MKQQILNFSPRERICTNCVDICRVICEKLRMRDENPFCTTLTIHVWLCQQTQEINVIQMGVISVWYYSDELINDNIYIYMYNDSLENTQDSQGRTPERYLFEKRSFYLKRKFYIHQIKIQQYFPIVSLITIYHYRWHHVRFTINKTLFLY